MILERSLISLIKLYQRIFFWKPQVCRFYPTCSEYAFFSIKKFGAWRGVYFSLKRILRCHPFSKGGRDEVIFDSKLLTHNS